MRGQAYRAALCGVLCALAAALMLLGGIVPAAVYCCPILAMVVLLPVREEFGSRWALTAYAAVSLLTLLLAANSEATFVYLFFGWYPAAQPRFYRLRPAVLRTFALLAVFGASACTLYLLLLKVFCLEAVTAEFAGYSAAFSALLLTLGGGVFLVTDRLLLRMSRLWNTRLRRHLLPK